MYAHVSKRDFDVLSLIRSERKIDYRPGSFTYPIARLRRFNVDFSPTALIRSQCSQTLYKIMVFFFVRYDDADFRFVAYQILQLLYPTVFCNYSSRSVTSCTVFTTTTTIIILMITRFVCARVSKNIQYSCGQDELRYFVYETNRRERGRPYGHRNFKFYLNNQLDTISP